MRLQGRHVIVVGVGSTIGTACATRFAREGAAVLAVGPDGDAASSVCGAILDSGGRARPYDAQFTDIGAVEVLAEELLVQWGHVDGLVYCGTAMDVWPTETDDLGRWAGIAQVNVLGPVAWTRPLVPLLARAGGASVVYLGSVDGIRGNWRVPAYSMTKAALGPLTHMMAQEHGRRGIRFNCVAAAGILQMGSGSPPVERQTSDNELLMQLTPLGRRPDPSEIASVCLFFLSDDSSYVTGTVLPVDGGRLAPTPGTN